MNWSDQLEHFLCLPQGRYFTAPQARISIKDGLCVAETGLGVTNAGSLHPVIGAAGLYDSAVMMLHNPRTRTAALLTDHFSASRDYIDIGHEEALQRLVRAVRRDEADLLHLHVVGHSWHKTATPTDAVCEGILHTGNVRRIQNNLMDCIQAVKSHPNLMLKTFDVLDKPKPLSVAIDARSGRLIRGTALMHSDNDIQHFHRVKSIAAARVKIDPVAANRGDNILANYAHDTIAGWKNTKNMPHPDFDGTEPHLQRSRDIERG